MRQLFFLRPVRPEWSVTRICEYTERVGPLYAKRGITLVPIPTAPGNRPHFSTSPSVPRPPRDYSASQKEDFREAFRAYIRNARAEFAARGSLGNGEMD